MRPTEARALGADLLGALTAAADPLRAEGMRAYLKSAMPCLGVDIPTTRKVVRAVFAAQPLASFADWEQVVRTIWDGAHFREERLAAIELTGLKAYSQHQTPAALPLYRHLVVTGAWWDLVDPVATDRVSRLALDHPAEIVPTLLEWSRLPGADVSSGDLWLRRTAVIHQVGNKARTDTDRLQACIEPALPSREFFLRKAVGWALRDYAWTDPAWVQAYVRANESRLSGLSRREALKNVGPG